MYASSGRAEYGDTACRRKRTEHRRSTTMPAPDERAAFVIAMHDQIKAAIRNRDSDGLDAAIKELFAHEPDVAMEAVERLTVIGLERMTGVAGITDPSTASRRSPGEQRGPSTT
jgi:DNA-binding GntR family transcriptional regulator